jgi:hypothetical protein
MLFSEGNYHRRENNPRFPINKWSILAGSHPVDPGMGEDWLHQAPGLTCLVVYNAYKHPTVDESKFTFRSIAFHSSLWLERAHSDRFCSPGLRDVCLLIKNALNWRRVILHGSPSHPRQKCWSSSMVHRPKVKKNNDDPKAWALQNMPETTPAKLVVYLPL